MDTPAPDPADDPVSTVDTLATMPIADFVAAWRVITGEPPAIVLSSRSAMLALLVDSVPAAPLQPPTPRRDGPAPGARTGS